MEPYDSGDIIWFPLVLSVGINLAAAAGAGAACRGRSVDVALAAAVGPRGRRKDSEGGGAHTDPGPAAVPGRRGKGTGRRGRRGRGAGVPAMALAALLELSLVPSGLGLAHTNIHGSSGGATAQSAASAPPLALPPLLPRWSGNQPCGEGCAAATPANGFDPLPSGNVTHTTVYRAGPAHGTYSHGAIPYYWGGLYMVSWASAPMDEGVAERSVVAVSADLVQWAAPVELFPNRSAAAADGDPAQGTNNENFWETPPQRGGGGGGGGGSGAAAAADQTGTRLYAFASLIVTDDPSLPGNGGRLRQYLLGRRLTTVAAAAGGGGGGSTPAPKLAAGPIFWASVVRTKPLSFCCASTVFLPKTVPFRAVCLSQAPPPDLLGYPLYSQVPEPTTRADIQLYLSSIVSEFVPGEARFNRGALDERSIYRLPGPGPPRLVQLVRSDNGSLCPPAMRAATNCSACAPAVAKSCLLASTCTVAGTTSGTAPGRAAAAVRQRSCF
eukprot:SAG22_NODE_2054_length_3070_cov_1.685291_5_plen_497_part_00